MGKTNYMWINGKKRKPNIKANHIQAEETKTKNVPTKF